MRWKSLWCIHRDFSYESTGERILKISPQLPKLLSNVKWCTFFETLCTITVAEQIILKLGGLSPRCQAVASSAKDVVAASLLCVVQPGTHWRKFNSTRSTLLEAPYTHWRQGRKDVQHSGDNVDRVGDIVDRDKLSNSSCCRFVAKTVSQYWRQSTLLRICRRFRQQSTLSPVSTGL